MFGLNDQGVFDAIKRGQSTIVQIDKNMQAIHRNFQEVADIMKRYEEQLKTLNEKVDSLLEKKQ